MEIAAQKSYDVNRAWSDRFLDEVRKYVGPHLLEPSSFDIDTKQAADLVVMRAKNLTIGVRIRRPGYLPKYKYDFTIRARTKYNNETELDKITSGWGDWFFYGHSDEQQKTLSQWMLIDLHAFRANIMRGGIPYPTRFDFIPNGDGTFFAPFDVRLFKQPRILIAHGTPGH